MNPNYGYLYLGDALEIAFKMANVIVQMTAMITSLSRKSNSHGCICPDMILITNEGKTLKLVDSFLINPILGQSIDQ